MKWNGYYIEASQEVYDKLVKLGYKKTGTFAKLKRFVKNYIYINNTSTLSGCTKEWATDRLSLKPFYLVDGEFTEDKPKGEEDKIINETKKTNDRRRMEEGKENTISITSDDGVIYKFKKPNFDCELLKIVTHKNPWDTQIVGYVLINSFPEPVCWYFNGECYGTLDKLSNNKVKDYHLIPIEPK